MRYQSLLYLLSTVCAVPCLLYCLNLADSKVSCHFRPWHGNSSAHRWLYIAQLLFTAHMHTRRHTERVRPFVCLLCFDEWQLSDLYRRHWTNESIRNRTYQPERHSRTVRRNLLYRSLHNTSWTTARYNVRLVPCSNPCYLVVLLNLVA